MLTLHNFLTRNRESYSCGFHTTWVISNRGSYMTRSQMRDVAREWRNPNSTGYLNPDLQIKKQYERENDTGERMDYDALSARLFFRWERMTACSYYCLARTRGYTYWNSCVYILWQTMGYCCAHFIGNRYQMRLGWGSFPQCFLMWLQLNLTEFQ